MFKEPEGHHPTEDALLLTGPSAWVRQESGQGGYPPPCPSASGQYAPTSWSQAQNTFQGVALGRTACSYGKPHMIAFCAALSLLKKKVSEKWKFQRNSLPGLHIAFPCNAAI